MSSSADGGQRPARSEAAQASLGRPLGLVVLVSGRGSNLQAIVDAIARGELSAEVRAVISNRGGAGGLEYARRAGIPAELVDDAGYAGRRRAYETALISAIERHRPDLVVLAGFMRILSSDFVHRYDGRMVNIHPSLLPAFTGLDTHRRALEAKASEHGASVHFVTADVDGGPVIVRARLPVARDDTPASLAERVLRLEHRIYPLALRWFAEGRVRKRGDAVLFDGRPLDAPLEYEA